MSTEENLFDELYGPRPNLPLTDSPPNDMSISELIQINPAQSIEFDLNNEISIQRSTDHLKYCLKASEGVVDAAYRLREYVPNLNSTERNAFWKESVIPNLLKVINQDVKARSMLVYAFSAVRDLGIVIQKASELVRETRGSERAIEIAKKNIPAALDKLDQYIEKAEGLDTSVIDSFASDSKELFETVGPEAGKFLAQRAEIEAMLERLYERQNDLCNKFAEYKAEATRYNYLIEATEKYLSNEKDAGEATMRRIEELNAMNSETERKIQKTSGSNMVNIESFTKKSRKAWWFWRPDKKTFIHETSTGSDREAEKKYYESLLVARIARLKEEHKNDKSNKEKIDELSKSLADHKNKYEQAKKKLENFTETFPKRNESLQNHIISLYKTLDEMNEDQKDVEKKIGLTGSTLMACLLSIQRYARQIKKGSNAYSPFVSILNGIKSLVQSDVELLSGSNTDIFIAGMRLTKCVGFLSKFSVSIHEVLELDEKHNGVDADYERSYMHEIDDRSCKHDFNGMGRSRNQLEDFSRSRNELDDLNQFLHEIDDKNSSVLDSDGRSSSAHEGDGGNPSIHEIDDRHSSVNGIDDEILSVDEADEADDKITN